MLKKLSHAFYIVSIILSALAIVGYIVTAVYCGVNIQAIKEIVQNSNTSSSLTAEQIESIAAMAVAMVITICIVCGISSVVNLIVSIIAKNKKTTSLHIVSIVFGFLSSTYFSIAAGILGIIANKKEENQNDNVVVD